MLCIVPKDFSSFPQLSSRLSSMSATGSPVTWLHLSSDRLEKNRFHLLSDYDTNTELLKTPEEVENSGFAVFSRTESI